MQVIGMSKFSFDSYVNKIEEQKLKLSQGRVNCIPFTDKFPKLSKVLPGIIKGTYYITTANSGVGKTQFTKYMFVRTPYDYVKAHPEAGIKLKILYFALEESKEEFINSIIVAWLADTYGIEIDVLKLNSMLEPVEDSILEKVKEGRKYFEDLFEIVDVIDSVSNPYGLYKYCREYSNDNGEHLWTQLKLNDETQRKYIKHLEYEQSNKELWKYSHYEPHNEDEYVIIITDHISLLQPENGKTLHQTMSDWSVNYCRKQITKHWKYIIVNVQQQAAASEDIEHFKASKMEPSLSGLADNKLTARDALVVLGLFAPARYEIEKYMGYDIKKFKDNFRSLIILKNRIGIPNHKLALYFDGAVNRFKELPKADETDKLEKVYKILEK